MYVVEMLSRLEVNQKMSQEARLRSHRGRWAWRWFDRRILRGLGSSGRRGWILRRVGSRRIGSGLIKSKGGLEFRPAKQRRRKIVTHIAGGLRSWVGSRWVGSRWAGSRWAGSRWSRSRWSRSRGCRGGRPWVPRGRGCRGGISSARTKCG